MTQPPLDRRAAMLLALNMNASSHTAPDHTLSDFVAGQIVYFEGRQWDGELRFQNVFRGYFPNPEKAVERTTALLNNTAIAMARVMYPDRYAYIVCSTMPEGLTAEEEFFNQRDLAVQIKAHLENQQGETLGGGDASDLFDYRADAGNLTVTRSYRNVVPSANNNASLFPLEIVFSSSLTTVSVARSHLFTVGTNRIEVAVLAAVTDDTADAVQKSVDAETDALLESVRSCTQSLLGAR